MTKDKGFSYKYILLMKAGPYCGYTLNEIVDIKQKEQKTIGKFFWGYGGVFCRPNILQTYISLANSENEDVHVLFSETKSSYTTDTADRFTKHSSDATKWVELPKEVLLVGNSKKPHFAITANDLKKKEFELNISDYCTMQGVFPNPDRPLDEYFRYRVDKAFARYNPQSDKQERLVKVNYVAKLVAPFSVHIM